MADFRDGRGLRDEINSALDGGGTLQTVLFRRRPIQLRQPLPKTNNPLATSAQARQWGCIHFAAEPRECGRAQAWRFAIAAPPNHSGDCQAPGCHLFCSPGRKLLSGEEAGLPLTRKSAWQAGLSASSGHAEKRPTRERWLSVALTARSWPLSSAFRMHPRRNSTLLPPRRTSFQAPSPTSNPSAALFPDSRLR